MTMLAPHPEAIDPVAENELIDPEPNYGIEALPSQQQTMYWYHKTLGRVGGFLGLSNLAICINTVYTNPYLLDENVTTNADEAKLFLCSYGVSLICLYAGMFNSAKASEIYSG